MSELFELEIDFEDQVTPLNLFFELVHSVPNNIKSISSSEKEDVFSLDGNLNNQIIEHIHFCNTPVIVVMLFSLLVDKMEGTEPMLMLMVARDEGYTLNINFLIENVGTIFDPFFIANIRKYCEDLLARFGGIFHLNAGLEPANDKTTQVFSWSRSKS